MSDATASGPSWHSTVADAAARVEAAGGPRSIPLFGHGTLLLKYYAPRGVDKQTPHTRDEVYVVARGRGVFFDGTERRSFAAGDMLFVAAGVEHRFEDFSDDLGVWVMFYGPEDGEAP